MSVVTRLWRSASWGIRQLRCGRCYVWLCRCWSRSRVAQEKNKSVQCVIRQTAERRHFALTRVYEGKGIFASPSLHHPFERRSLAAFEVGPVTHLAVALINGAPELRRRSCAGT